MFIDFCCIFFAANIHFSIFSSFQSIFSKNNVKIDEALRQRRRQSPRRRLVFHFK